jgi:hypothetical protein
MKYMIRIFVLALLSVSIVLGLRFSHPPAPKVTPEAMYTAHSEAMVREIRAVYKNDGKPGVVAYCGGYGDRIHFVEGTYLQCSYSGVVNGDATYDAVDVYVHKKMEDDPEMLQKVFYKTVFLR